MAELTGLLELSSWPAGTRIIIRREVPHPGAQLRLTDGEGRRITCFATNTARGRLAALELRHRRWAPIEDRIRCAQDTGLANRPLHDTAYNKVWLAVVLLACDLLTQTRPRPRPWPRPARCAPPNPRQPESTIRRHDKITKDRG